MIKETKMLQVKANVVYNKKIKDNFFIAALDAAGMAKCALPGQFVNIKVNDSIEPLLRRPFSIHRVDDKRVGILYEIIGKGSHILSHKKPGEYLDVIGPLGNGFNYSLPTTHYQLSILVAGGMGVAPLMFLAKKLSGGKAKGTSSKLMVLIGAKNKSQILCADEFRKLGCKVKIATDDGSFGYKGKVTELLRSILPATCNLPLATIYACGPRPMLKEITRISCGYKIPAQISLEEHMSCGIGACLGCAVKTKEGFKRVCKEGPVFNAEEIIW